MNNAIQTVGRMLPGSSHLPRQAASKAPTITPVILELGGGDGAENAQGQGFFGLMLRFPPSSAKRTGKGKSPNYSHGAEAK
jgi:hypothetical protein